MQLRNYLNYYSGFDSRHRPETFRDHHQYNAPVESLDPSLFSKVKDVLLNRSTSDTVLAPKSKFLDRKWKQIGREEAQECVGPAGKQTWVELDGTEKVCCNVHGEVAVCRVWIRE
jgi:hypothetical protein